MTTISYALVARGSIVLAEYGGVGQANAGVVAKQILDRVPGNDDNRVSYSQDRYIFHVKRTDGITVLCMASDAAGRKYLVAYRYGFFLFCLG